MDLLTGQSVWLVGPGNRLGNRLGNTRAIAMESLPWTFGSPDFRDGSYGDGSYGRISMGVSGGVINQISTMSEFDTAMQPSVQSTFA